VVAADGSSGPPVGLRCREKWWVNEFTWAPDSRSIFYIPLETGEHMFEQAIYRVSVSGDRRSSDTWTRS